MGRAAIWKKQANIKIQASIKCQKQGKLGQRNKEAKGKTEKGPKNIHDELKKTERLRISLEGLQKLSESSIKSIQNRREKGLLRLKNSVNNLSAVTRDLRKTEERLRKSP